MTSKTLSNVTEMRAHLESLRRERALIALGARSSDTAYLASLDDEIDAADHAFVGAAVTEIAALRADFSGLLRG